MRCSRSFLNNAKTEIQRIWATVNYKHQQFLGEIKKKFQIYYFLENALSINTQNEEINFVLGNCSPLSLSTWNQLFAIMIRKKSTHNLSLKHARLRSAPEIELAKEAVNLRSSNLTQWTAPRTQVKNFRNSRRYTDLIFANICYCLLSLLEIWEAVKFWSPRTTASYVLKKPMAIFLLKPLYRHIDVACGARFLDFIIIGSMPVCVTRHQTKETKLQLEYLSNQLLLTWFIKSLVLPIQRYPIMFHHSYSKSNWYE